MKQVVMKLEKQNYEQAKTQIEETRANLQEQFERQMTEFDYALENLKPQEITMVKKVPKAGAKIGDFDVEPGHIILRRATGEEFAISEEVYKEQYEEV
jgi:hypothetical protein